MASNWIQIKVRKEVKRVLGELMPGMSPNKALMKMLRIEVRRVVTRTGVPMQVAPRDADAGP